MRSTILYDWWLRDGMINTDRQVVRTDGSPWTWRRMLEMTKEEVKRGIYRKWLLKKSNLGLRYWLIDSTRHWLN